MSLQWEHRPDVSVARLHGVEIISDHTLVDRNEDWSQVRSPGRARRRRAQGKRQRIVVHVTPSKTLHRFEARSGGMVVNKIVGHPAMIQQMIEEIERQNREAEEARAAGLDPTRGRRLRELWAEERGRGAGEVLRRTGQVWLSDAPREAEPFRPGRGPTEKKARAVLFTARLLVKDGRDCLAVEVEGMTVAEERA